MPGIRSALRKASAIRMVLLDVDGVMTDGGIYYSEKGGELKRFNAHDGYGVVRAHEHGLRVGIISGRFTPVVDARAKALHIRDVYQNRVDKVEVMKEIRRQHRLTKEQICFMGDELFDIPLLGQVGFSAAPKNARPEVKRIVDYVTNANGGDGAVREVIDLIIRSQMHRK